MHVWTTIIHYIYHIVYVYRLYHQSFSMLFVFLSAAVDTADAIHWHDYSFLGCISWACIIDVRFLQRFWQNMSILRAPIWEIKLHFSRKPRASSAQAKRCIQVEVRNGTPCSTAFYSHQNSRQRRLAKYCQRFFSTQRIRLPIRLTEKRSAQVHWCTEIEAWVFLLAGLMIVRQGMFFN